MCGRVCVCMCEGVEVCGCIISCILCALIHAVHAFNSIFWDLWKAYSTSLDSRPLEKGDLVYLVCACAK